MSNSGYFDCVCCGEIDIASDTEKAALCDTCVSLECSPDGESPECRELFLCDSRGVYIPQDAWQCIDWSKLIDPPKYDPWVGEALEAGPDHESYWDAWSEVTDSPIGDVERNGVRYTVYLEPDGDLFVRYYLAQHD